jgi:subtilase family serine protease
MLKRKIGLKLLVAGLGMALVIAGSGVASAAGHRLKAADHRSCSVAAEGSVGCLAIRRTVSVNGIVPRASSPRALIEPNGQGVFGAKALRKAYGITALGSATRTVAVVDAFHAATALSALNAYRAAWGFAPLAACGSGSGQCFSQITQDGSSSTGNTTDDGWAQETVLDVEMATAMCPNCSIAVVEASTAAFADFNTAVGTASNLPGVVAISNSYGGPEVSESSYGAYESAYQKGIAVVASAGDSGFGVESPASFQHVIAAGGTSLYVSASGSYSSESAWSGSGSGCARGPAPEWQLAALTHCAGKAIADVSAMANPATGVAVFYDGQWLIFGGTSASSPIIAGILAVKHNYGVAANGFKSAGQVIWDNRALLHDVTQGSNGSCRNYCKSQKGWDGPSGLGSPSGTRSF